MLILVLLFIYLKVHGKNYADATGESADDKIMNGFEPELHSKVIFPIVFLFF